MSTHIREFFTVLRYFVYMHKQRGVFLVNLYERIEQLCKRQSLSINKMCEKAGIRSSILYDIKSGKKQGVSRATAEKIANALRISVDELYGEKEKTPDTNVSEVDLRIANVIKVMTDEQKELFLNLAEQLIQQ